MTLHLSHTNRRWLEAMVHFISWTMVLASPLLLMQQPNDDQHLTHYWFHMLVPLSLLCVFYLNYWYYIPRILFQENQLWRFLAVNTLTIVALALALRYASSLYFGGFRHHPGDRVPPPQYVFFFRDVTSLVFAVCISVAIRVSRRLQESEAARREAVKSRTEAELKNLRNQLNPHFLLNTLNNIYALISFDADKAQQAVQELSKLLRYVLYDNQSLFVPLSKEADFIRNYIELMRIRIPTQVSLEARFDIQPGSQTPIAPLLFISLIENAFKHGISLTEPSFIHICLSEDATSVCCRIVNSNHPKSRSDKSGSGIGLQQVSQRLELLYPGHYRWERQLTDDGKTYVSSITLFQPSSISSNPLS